MVGETKIKEELQQTEVGLIPLDWKVYPLSEIIKLKSGFAFSSSSFSDVGPIILTPGNFKLEGGLYFEKRNTKRYSGTIVPSMVFEYRDLLIVMTDLTPDCNLLGKPAFVEISEPVLHNQRIAKVNSIKENISKDFLYWIFLSKDYLSRIKETATGSTVRHTSNNSIYSTKIPLPPTKAEQTAIATALNDIDALIEGLEQLLVKKRNIKQGAMQELLTGRRRLEGFTKSEGFQKTEAGEIPADWIVESIGNVCEIFGRIGFRGYTVNDIVKKGYGAISLSPSNIVEGKLDLSKCTYISYFKYEESPEIKIFNGDVLLVKTGSTFGKTAVVRNLNEKTTLNPQVVVLKKIKIDNHFLGYVMGSKIIQRQVNDFIVGGAIPTLSQKQVATFKIPLPPSKKEQTAIAKAVMSMDEEIERLETQLSKYKLLKTGMMQELLTGKKRLI